MASENLRGAVPPVGRGSVQVSRPLCVATLIWIVFLLAIISIPRSAWINSVATLAALGVGACWYFWGRPRGPADAQGPSRSQAVWPTAQGTESREDFWAATAISTARRPSSPVTRGSRSWAMLSMKSRISAR